jgi:hypothetical protein
LSRTLGRLSAGAVAWFLAATIAGPATADTGPVPDPPTNVTARAGDQLAAASIGGQVVPTHAGQPVRLQQKVGRTWRTVQTRSLPGSGRFGFALRPRATGTTCSWGRAGLSGTTTATPAS